MTNHTGKRVEDFFASGDDFEGMLTSAEQAVHNQYQSDFCFKLRQNWEQYGMRGYISDQAYATFCAMAGF